MCGNFYNKNNKFSMEMKNKKYIFCIGFLAGALLTLFCFIYREAKAVEATASVPENPCNKCELICHQYDQGR
jgi:hypothetical protein